MQRIDCDKKTRLKYAFQTGLTYSDISPGPGVSSGGSGGLV